MIIGKPDLVAEVARQLDVTQSETRKVLDGLVEVIGQHLEQEHEVRLLGFGTFAVQKTKERQGRNLQTKEVITIAASCRPVFRAGKDLKARVKQKARY